MKDIVITKELFDRMAEAIINLRHVNSFPNKDRPVLYRKADVLLQELNEISPLRRKP